MRLYLAALFMLVSSSAIADDRSDCISGPLNFETSLSDVVNSVQERLVACFNYTNTTEVENHNAQQKLLRDLKDRVDDLEHRVLDLERR